MAVEEGLEQSRRCADARDLLLHDAQFLVWGQSFVRFGEIRSSGRLVHSRGVQSALHGVLLGVLRL